MTRREPPTPPADDQMLEFPDWLIERIEALPDKRLTRQERAEALRHGRDPVSGPTRAKALLRLILRQGEVYTLEFQRDHGYSDPASAKRDARNIGFLVETKYRTIEGTSQAVYYVSTAMTPDTRVGALRRNLPERFRRELLAHYGNECRVCRREGGDTPGKKLQPDHRVPFDIAGDPGMTVEEFMPLCGSCNRSKSWECEHCPNWQIRNEETCRTCYWGLPDGDYTHLATRDERRLDVMWQDDDVVAYDALKAEAVGRGITIQELVKIRIT